jgi:hypothetical protein
METCFYKTAIKHRDGKIFITCILEVFQISADIIFLLSLF